MKKRCIAFSVAVIALVGLLSGCMSGCTGGTGTGGKSKISIPALSSIWKPTQEPAPSRNTCTLYYDNTLSMDGFVAPGRKGMKSNYLSALSGVYERMEQWENSTYFCIGKKGAYLDWIPLAERTWDKKKFPQPPDTFMEAYAFEDFYKPPASFATGMGPMQLLVGETSPVDWEVLSIIVTDMAEQQMQGGRLANALANHLLSQADFSISMFAMRSNYDGIPYTTMDGYARSDGSGVQMYNQRYQGIRQFYLILCGPTVDVLRFANQLESTLTDDKQLKAGEDFHRADFLSNDGLGSVDIGTVKTAASLGIQSFSEKLYPLEAKILQTGIVTPSNSNETINFLKVNSEDFIEDAGGGEGLFCFRYEKSANVKSDDGCVVFYVPLPTLRDGKTAIYESEESSDLVGESVDGQRKVSILPLKLDDISFWLGSYNKTAGAQATEIETGLEGDATTVARAMPARLINALSELKNTEDKEKILRIETPMQYQNKTKIERFDDLLRNEDGSIYLEQFDVKQQGALRDNSILNTPAYEVTQEGGALKIKLYFKDIPRLRQRAEVLVIQLPMKVRIPPADIIPNWVSEWNGTGQDNTFGLNSFFAGMTGNNVGDPGYETLWSNFRLTELINLRIVIKLK